MYTDIPKTILVLFIDQDIYDPRDADKEEFNIDMFMMDITENCNLQMLVAKKNTVDTEIKELSSDLQNTVYENYSKFIKASKTVSNITRNFDKMTKEMDLLQSKMCHLENTSSHILNKLQPSKDGIVKWSKSRESVHKLISLIDLVPNMKQLIEEGDYSAAVHHYAKAKNVLKQNRHLISLKGIIEDSDEIVSIIKLNMSEKLNCDKYESGVILETMELLLELGEESVTIIQNVLFVTSRNVNNIFEMIKKRFPLLSENPDQDLTSTELKLSDCSSLCCKYFETLSKIINIVQKVFVKTNMNNSPILESFVIEHTEALHDEMRRIFREHFTDFEDEYIANILDDLYRKCHECYVQIPKTALSSRNVNFLLYVCVDRSSFKLNKMRERFDGRIQSLEEELRGKLRLNDSLVSLNAVVEDIFLSTLSSLCPYINPENRYSRNVCFRKQFCKTVVHEGVFISFIRHMNNTILRKCYNSNTKRQTIPCLYILLAKFTLQMSTHRVQDLLSQVKEKVYSSDQLSSIHEIANECNIIAEKVLHSYVNARQAKISSMLKNSFENKDWMNMKEPWKVSAVVRIALEDFEETLREIESLFRPFSRGIRSRDRNHERTASFNAYSRTSSPDRNSHDGILTKRIYQLFSRSPVYLDTVKFESESILSCIVKLTLKSLLECVRNKTFNQFGLQQMQVDVFCLELWVLRYLKNGQDYILLFDDIISSCYNRTIEPKFMNHCVVSEICQSF